MRLSRDWKRVLRYAWSVKLLGLLLLINGGEAAVAYLAEIKPGFWMLLFSTAVNGLAIWARVLVQKQFPEDV